MLRLCLWLSILIVSGCMFEATDPQGESKPIYPIHVDQEDQKIVAYLPDGMAFFDLWNYRQYIPGIAKQAMDRGYDVRVEYGQNISQQLNSIFGSNSVQTADVAGEIGTVKSPLYIGFGFHLTSGIGDKYVAGCVKSMAYRVAIRLNHYSDQVFDLHLATYVKNGSRCFGAYESAQKFINWCTCGPVDYDDLKEFIYQASIAAGIWASLAVVIADTAAPIALGALAL